MNALQTLVQQRLDERGWTRGQLATRSGLPRSTVYRLMDAPFKGAPKRRTLDAIADALELPQSVVLGAAAEASGLQLYDESRPDEDLTVLIAAAKELPAAQRRALTRMAEALLDEAREASRQG